MNKIDTGMHYPLAICDLPSGWLVTYAHEVCDEVQSGFACGRHSDDNIGVAHLRPMNVSKDGKIDLDEVKFVRADVDKRRLTERDVLFNNTNSPELIGKTALVGSQAQGLAFSNHMTRVCFNPAVVPEFGAYQLHYLWMARYYLHQCVKHVNQASISSGDFAKSIPVIVPPVAEQKRIITKIEELFSALDKGVESLKTARTKLNVYRQAVLKHAFEGKLTAQWREENKDKLETPEQLLARIKREREVRYEQQLQGWKAAVKEWEGSGKSGRKPPKPQKPKNPLPIAVSPVDSPFWTRLSLDELAVEAVLGKMLDKEKNTGTPRYYLGNINLRWGKFDLENLKTMKVEESEIERYRLAKGDLVICEGGEPGRCAVWDGQESTMLIQKALHRVRFTESYSPYFAYYFMTYAASSGLLSPNFTGSTIKHLTGKGLGNVLFPLCTLTEQNQIVHCLDRAFHICDELDRQIGREIRRSNSLRQSVLSKAFSGQLVPQDPNDEPASVLLDRIRAERERAVKNNHPKKTKKRKTAA